MITREEIVYRQEDKRFSFTFKDADSELIDFSTGYDDVMMFVYKPDQSILVKYKMDEEDDFKALDSSEQEQGILSFILESADTILAPLGKLYVEILIRKNNNDLEDGSFDTVVQKYLCTIKNSRSSEEEL